MHSQSDLTILGWSDVRDAVTHCELQLIDVVKSAYLAHERGKTSLPHSSFLRFPSQPSDRIIALPAHLDCGQGMAGLKWISSFPGNTAKGIDRASAVMILNSVETGRPHTILEASTISAKRTAASAALAAQLIHADPHEESIGLLGCGLINFETARFLRAVFPRAIRFTLYDLHRQHAEFFRERALAAGLADEIYIAPSSNELLASAKLISIATTASTPHIHSLEACQPDSTILHVSLRDLSPEVILACDNTTDDISHVCRENTSLHLAENQTGNRDFIRGAIGGILSGRIPARAAGAGATAVFSPFGLGILDLAVANWIVTRSRERHTGHQVDAFLPTGRSW